MTNDLIPPPELDLRPATRGRQRNELMRVVARESTRRRVPRAPNLIAAAAVAAVIAGGLFGIPAYRDSNRSPDPAATPSSRPLSTIHQLTAAEIKTTLAACRAQTNAVAAGTKGRFGNTTVVDAFTFTDVKSAGYTKTWLVGRRPTPPLQDTLEVCGLDINGKLVSAQETVVAPMSLMSLVESSGRNYGRFSLPVARVTVQATDGPEIDAVARNGFWFAPLEHTTKPFDSWESAARQSVGSPVGVYPGVRLRGYSGSGRLLYDSARDAYKFEDCWPSGGGEAVCPQTAWKRADPTR
ncbi:hypothetical protein AB0L70_29950 [Kribbella sp. NPDC051952]|uniref:hypothetical protein n=1 Tax=Kribbella sp. NPDC051952 TaxID=3154851 RepID=UPI003430C8BF